MSTDPMHEVEALQTKLREQKNAAFAGLFLAVLVTLLSVAYLTYIDMYDPNEPEPESHQAVISADSLRHLMYTIDEQSREIESQAAQIRMLEEQLADTNDAVEPAESAGATEPKKREVSAAPPKPKPISTGSAYHVVKEGESLWSIAQLHFGDGFRASELASLNGLQDAGLIVVGETLVLEK